MSCSKSTIVFVFLVLSGLSRADFSISQNFEGGGTTYSTVQSNDNGGQSLTAPQVLGGGPSGNYLQLAQRSSSNGVDAQNAVVFSNSTQLSRPTSLQFDVKYHMQGNANGFGFVFLNTSSFGTDSGTASTLKLDRIQVEQAHNHDAIGVRQAEFFQQSFHLALNTFETDRVQLFYDGYKLLDQQVAYQDGWHNLSFQVDFLPNETRLALDSSYLANNSSDFSTSLNIGQIEGFNARPMLAARIGGAGFGNFSIDDVSFQQITAVPEPSSIAMMTAVLASVACFPMRRRIRVKYLAASRLK